MMNLEYPLPREEVGNYENFVGVPLKPNSKFIVGKVVPYIFCYPVINRRSFILLKHFVFKNASARAVFVFLLGRESNLNL